MKKGRSKAPGRHYRRGLSLIQLHRMFSDDAAAERWFIAARWPNGVRCPKCGSDDIQRRVNRKPQPHRCRTCRKDFSVKTDSLMHNSPMGYQVWATAIYLLTTNIKGVSSMKLHRDLEISQKSAWHLAHRIRENFADARSVGFEGPVEVDETYIGGRERNKPVPQETQGGSRSRRQDSRSRREGSPLEPRQRRCCQKYGPNCAARVHPRACKQRRDGLHGQLRGLSRVSEPRAGQAWCR